MPRDASAPMASPYEIMTGMNMSVALRVDQIDAGNRLRIVDPEKVEALKSSISEIGLRTLIAVTGDRRADGDPSIRVRLVAGAHRLEAMRQLGREHVGVVFEDGDDLDAELWEIDENLIRAELTPADRALFVFRRKEIYLLKYPETANGGDRRSDRQVGELKQEDRQRFTVATAVATGQSERAIQRDAERGEKISEKALRMLRGTHHDKGVTLDRLKALRPDEQEVYVKALFDADKEKTREAKELRESKQKLSRSVRNEIIKAIAEKGTAVAGEMPRAAFPVLYADPPWEQEAYSDETGQDKGLRYPAMPLDAIKALCAGDSSPATRDAILLLWTTASRLKDGLDVMAAWGFAYKSHLIWDKVNIGMGRWVRDRHELLLIGTRGDFPGLIPGTQPHSVYSETKGDHSVKPTWFAAEIDRLFPDLPKLELFQRKDSLHFADVRNGPTWSFWGFEAGGDEPSTETVLPEVPVAKANKKPQDTKPAKEKKQKLSPYQLAQRESWERKSSYRLMLDVAGCDDELLVKKASAELHAYDRAVRQADVEGMQIQHDRIDAIVEHLFGCDLATDWRGTGSPPKGSGRFGCLNDAKKWLMAQLAAPPGTVPMFGQPGRFLIELFGCRVDFDYEGLFGICGGNAHVVDLDKPFFSNTGYRSFQVGATVIHSGGLDCKSYMERVCTAQFTEGGKKKVVLHGPPLGTPWVRGTEKGFDDQTGWLLQRRADDPAYQPGGHLHAAIWGGAAASGDAEDYAGAPALPLTMETCDEA